MEKRMYFFVPYNISEIQKGIQAGHAAVEYARKFGNDLNFQDFADNHKTWIILNGGTTNNSKDDLKSGSLQLMYNEIVQYNNQFYVTDDFTNPGIINVATFNEPDLNDAMTAFCFICDQRVWDRKLVQNWDDYREDYYKESLGHDDLDEDELRDQWLNEIGGEKNEFLRALISGKKRA